MKRTCLFCNGPISTQRKGSAMYCSNEHYYEAKKLRSRGRYANLKRYPDELAKNHEALERAHFVQHFDRKLNLAELTTLGFVWGVSTGEIADFKGRIFTKVGEHYAYRVDPETKEVEIWKVK